MNDEKPVFVSAPFIARKANQPETAVDAFLKRTGQAPDAILSCGPGFNLELYSMPRVETLIQIMKGRGVTAPALEAVVSA